ncbi:MAG: hypothetical protein BWZ10_01164 [candidate division BRC1 bacterium ADurb.BinA364]|nr:MAG: hypothetical protein BWZ10_01164 [candidate division BRC1 bacterium ADurb.BinA364]
MHGVKRGRHAMAHDIGQQNAVAIPIHGFDRIKIPADQIEWRVVDGDAQARIVGHFARQSGALNHPRPLQIEQEMR